MSSRPKSRVLAGATHATAEPGVVFRNVARIDAERLLVGTPPGTYLVRPSSQDSCFALTFVKEGGDFGHLLMYRQKDGWIADNVEGVHDTLYGLLTAMAHFINVIDSPLLVPDSSKSSAERGFFQFLVEKHEFLGILFYRHSFSGLRKFRRILLHSILFLLLVGTNLFAYSVVDADCVKKDFCASACQDEFGAELCDRNVGIELITQSEDGTGNVVRYADLFRFRTPSTPNDAFDYCSDVRNPLWASAVVCLPLCQREIDRSFNTDVVKWKLPGNLTCNAPSLRNSTDLVCETVDSQPDLGIMTSSAAKEKFANRLLSCEGLVGSPFTLLTMIKSSVIAVFILICDQILTISLKLSQPVEWRTANRRILLRKPTAVAISYLLCALFIILSLSLIVVGVIFIGYLQALWQAAAVGLVVTIFLKYIVFSPMRIFGFWCLLKFGWWRFFSDNASEKLPSRTVRQVKVSKTMKRLEAMLVEGVEDVSYREHAEKKQHLKRPSVPADPDAEHPKARLLKPEHERAKSDQVRGSKDVELKELKKEAKVRPITSPPGALDAPLRIQSGTSRRRQTDASALLAKQAVDNEADQEKRPRPKSERPGLEKTPSLRFSPYAIRKGEEEDGVGDRMTRGSRQMARSKSLRGGLEADKPAKRPSSGVQRPVQTAIEETAPHRANYSLKQLDFLEKRDRSRGDLAEDLVSMAEGAAELYERESSQFFTSIPCCMFLFFLIFGFVAMGVFGLLSSCGNTGILGGSTLVSLVTFVFCVVMAAVLCTVRAKRDTVKSYVFPLVAVAFGLGVMLIGAALTMTIAINVKQCGDVSDMMMAVDLTEFA